MSYAVRRSMALLCAFVLLLASVLPVKPAAVEAADASKLHSGSYGLKMYAINASWGDTAYIPLPQLTPNTSYELKFWVKGTGILQVGAGTPKAANSNEVENNGSGNGTGHWNTTATAEWVQHTVTFNSGTHANWVVYLKDRGGGSKTNEQPIFLDDITVAAAGGGANLLENGGFENASLDAWHISPSLAANISLVSEIPNAGISPAAAQFNLRLGAQEDVVVGVTYNGHTLLGVRNGELALNVGTDYTVAENSLTIKKEYLSALPQGTVNLTVVFSGGVNPTLALTVFDDTPATIVDDLADFSNMFDRSLTPEGKETLRFTGDPANDVMNGDDGYRIFRKSLNDYTTAGETPYSGELYFTYRVSADIANFVLDVAYETTKPPVYPTFWLSADGASYTQLTDYSMVEVPVTGKPTWAIRTFSSFTAAGTLEGAKYLKIILPPENPAVESWAVQYGKLLVNSGVAHVVADPDPAVARIPEGGHLTVSLTTETVGASVYYYTDNNPSSTAVRYTGPFNIDKETKIHTYAAKEGFMNSGTLTYSYRMAGSYLVDTFGQKVNADFDKIASYDELRATKADDEAYYGSLTPPQWDEYGGLPGSKEQYGLEAKGFFNIQRADIDNDGELEYALVDPLGNLYFSVAANSTAATGGTYTLVTGREEIYEWLPTYEGGAAKYDTAFRNGIKDHFSHYIANYIEKYGKPFNSGDFYKLDVDRLLKWGFNSAGGFGADTSNPPAGGKKIPQVRFIDPPNTGFRFGTGSFFDAFKDGAREAAAAIMATGEATTRANDSNNIGYFFGNEIPYHTFTKQVMEAKASVTATKAKLVSVLQEKYGTIEAFNAAWKGNYADFAALGEAALSIKTDEAYDDMLGFFELWLDKYFQIMSEEFRKVNSNHLLLGDRLYANVANNSDLRDIIARVQGKYVDVLSYNYYTYDPDLDRLQSMVDLAGGKPVIITEFHYGEPGRGLGGGVKAVQNETDKGKSYRHYVEKAAASGLVVGAQWFANLDQSPTGRYFEGFNGEAFGIGFVDVTDRPYKELMSYIMETNYNIYDVLTGQQEPYTFLDYAGQDQSGKLASIAKAAGALVVDGVKDTSWPAGETIRLTDANRVLGVPNEGWEAEISLAWDDELLYIYADVDDPTPMKTGATDGSIWNGDGLELFVGPYKIEASGGILPRDTQLLIAATAEPASGNLGYRWSNNRSDQPVIQRAVTATATGYTMEAAIGLADLNIDFTGSAANKEIRFDIGFDNGYQDTTSVRRNAQYLWSGVDGNSASREKWGRAVLAGVYGADNALGIAVSEAEAPAGALVQVPVKLTNAVNLGGAEVELTYDAGKLQYQSISFADDLLGEVNADVPGTVRFAVISEAGLTAEELEAAVITFKVDENAAAGTETGIAISHAAASDSSVEQKDIPVIPAHGKVTVLAAEPGPSPSPSPSPSGGDSFPGGAGEPAYSASISKNGISGSPLPVKVNRQTGNASLELDGEAAGLLADGNSVTLTLGDIPDVSSYTLTLPASALTGTEGKGVLTVATPSGSLAVPGNLLSGVAAAGHKQASLTIGKGDRSALPGHVQSVSGDKPLLKLALALDGEELPLGGSGTPASVSIPYAPTAAELAEHEFIAVWRIDGKGNAVSVPSGRYNPASGTVTFAADEWGQYAVVFVHKVFSDMEEHAWARKAVEVLASKGVIEGTEESAYSPGAAVTRADYVTLLVRALGLKGDAAGNFEDVPADAYYYRTIGIARALGIVDGMEDNRFDPGAPVTRQDMMVLTARALKVSGNLKTGAGLDVLDVYSDRESVAEYATAEVASLVAEGLIAGVGNNRLNPGDFTSRAEAAALLYRVYNAF